MEGSRRHLVGTADSLWGTRSPRRKRGHSGAGPAVLLVPRAVGTVPGTPSGRWPDALSSPYPPASPCCLGLLDTFITPRPQLRGSGEGHAPHSVCCLGERTQSITLVALEIHGKMAPCLRGNGRLSLIQAHWDKGHQLRFSQEDPNDKGAHTQNSPPNTIFFGGGLTRD